jgi:hypothetical protein
MLLTRIRPNRNPRYWSLCGHRNLHPLGSLRRIYLLTAPLSLATRAAQPFLFTLTQEGTAPTCPACPGPLGACPPLIIATDATPARATGDAMVLQTMLLRNLISSRSTPDFSPSKLVVIHFLSCRQLTQNLIFTLPKTSVAQVS